MLANVERVYLGFGNACTHQGGSLSEGELDGDGGDVPLHDAVFNVKTEKALLGLGKAPVPTYGVQVQDSEIMVRPQR